MNARAGAAEEGFALTEVLVGFAILALVSIAMLRAFGGTTQTLRAVSIGEARLDLAERLLAERRAERVPDAGRREGVEDGLSWSTSLEAIPEPDERRAAESLFRLVVAVGRPGDEAPTPVLTTLVLGRAAR